MNDKIRALKCPHCGKITDNRLPQCIWCGRETGFASRIPQQWQMIWDDGTLLIKTITGLNIGMFILSLCLSTGLLQHFLNPLMILSPDTRSLLLLGATGTEPILKMDFWWALRWWSLLAANYLHGGILHIFFNMMALRQIAPVVIAEFGGRRFFILYTIGGVIGFLVSYLAGIPLTIGASAAICGLVGALLLFGWSRGGAYGNHLFRQVGSWVVMMFVIGFLIPGINNWGHLGGLIGGAALAWGMGYHPAGNQSRAIGLSASILAAATIGVLAWASFIAILVRFGLL